MAKAGFNLAINLLTIKLLSAGHFYSLIYYS